MLKRVLYRPIDRWAVMLVTTVFLCQLALYSLTDRVWLQIVGAMLLALPCLSIVAFVHNHIHLRTFRYPSLNRLFEIMMFFQSGQTPFSGTINHILGHHYNYFNPALDPLNWKRPDGSTMSRHEFAIRGTLEHYRSSFVFGQQKPQLLRQFHTYLVVCSVLLVAMIRYRPIPALIVFVFPMISMLYILKWSAWAHHAGLEIGDDYTGSRTHTGRIYNWIYFNAGYHAAHHFKESLHWSLLPEYHERELAAKIPAELQGDDWGENFKRLQASFLR